MTKNIFKEILIVLLLLAVVILVFGIIFYDYIPNSKTPPAKVQAYEIPEEVEVEIKETLSQEKQNVIKTYSIDTTDLSLYESLDSYDKGKADPFAKSATTLEGGNTVSGNTQNSNTINTNNNTSQNTTGNRNSTGSFFNNEVK